MYLITTPRIAYCQFVQCTLSAALVGNPRLDRERSCVYAQTNSLIKPRALESPGESRRLCSLFHFCMRKPRPRTTRLFAGASKTAGSFFTLGSNTVPQHARRIKEETQGKHVGVLVP